MSTLDWDPPAFGMKEKCKVVKNTWPGSGMASSSMLERLYPFKCCESGIRGAQTVWVKGKNALLTDDMGGDRGIAMVVGRPHMIYKMTDCFSIRR